MFEFCPSQSRETCGSLWDSNLEKKKIQSAVCVGWVALHPSSERVRGDDILVVDE